jgi:hypothetical protein
MVSRLTGFQDKIFAQGGPLQLRGNDDDRDFYLKVGPEWLRRRSNATTKSRLDALGLVPFFARKRIGVDGLTATGQEVITHFEREGEPEQ